MQEIPHGFCHCGCGKKTNIASRTIPKNGAVKGEPNRYLLGHKRTPRSSAEGFWARVTKTHADECWDWQGCTDPRFPYGHLMFETKKWTAHRLAWFLTNGTIPKGLCVLHKCDNPRCCNPSHLFLGTVQDNIDDMKAKGRCRSAHTGKWPRNKHGVIQKTEPTLI